MKRYLYEIVDKDSRLPLYDTPWMPRVFAEKTAKTVNREIKKERPWDSTRYVAVKVPISPTRFGTPRGQKSWHDWFQKRMEGRE